MRTVALTRTAVVAALAGVAGWVPIPVVAAAAPGTDLAWATGSATFRNDANGTLGRACLGKGGSFLDFLLADAAAGSVGNHSTHDYSCGTEANANAAVSTRASTSAIGLRVHLSQGPQPGFSQVEPIVTGAVSMHGHLRVDGGDGSNKGVRIQSLFQLHGSVDASGPRCSTSVGTCGGSGAALTLSFRMHTTTVTSTLSAGYQSLNGQRNFWSDGSLIGASMTPEVMVPGNALIEYVFTLAGSASALVHGWSPGYFNGTADYLHTLTLPTDGPVFVVPEGYTVNSPSLGIVNNRFVSAAPVPEPAAAVLWAGGLLGLAAWRARRRATHACAG